MPRAKIVCTLGPATEAPGAIRALVDAGMSVARLNFSHGTHEDKKAALEAVRRAAVDLDQSTAVLADLQGPKIRLGVFPGGPVELVQGATFTITTDDVPGTAERASTTYAGLPGDTRVGDPILVDDGKVQLRVTQVTGSDVVTSVEVGGMVSDHKGINLPGVAVSVPALTAKDEDDLRYALGIGVDAVALSFVRSAADYQAVRHIMHEVGRTVPVIAKLEKPQAIEALEDIVKAFDGIMVARGDLGVELPLERVPLVQKQAIDLARRHAKPVIVATQMLESMIQNARPTRAEASDCANAVLDGADALMLSGETAVGAYPVEAVSTMASIIDTTEREGGDRIAPMSTRPHTRAGVICLSAAAIARQLGARYLVTFTESGESARRVARLRSPIPHVALTPNDSVRRALSLSWGVEAHTVERVTETDQMIAVADDVLRRTGLAVPGDTVVIVSGAPLGVSGTINQILVHHVGELDRRA